MKYYTYISDTKLNMLYDQIPESVLKQIAAQLKIDLKVLSVTISLPTSQEQAKKFAKLEVVIHYLRKQELVGTIEQPNEYFAGTADMHWGPLYTANSEVVFFGGKTISTVFGLGGSLQHVIGQVGPSVAGSANSAASTMPVLLRVLSAQLHPKSVPTSPDFSFGDNQEALDDVASMVDTMAGPSQKLEYLAKRLLDSEGPTEIRGLASFHRKRVMLGTPLYVAC